MSADLDILTFRNVREFVKYLDEQIMSIEKKLGEIASLLESIKARRAKYEKIRKMIEDITGETKTALSTIINISGLRIIVDPRPIEEYELLENVYKSLGDKLNVLRRIKEVVMTYLEKYLDEEMLNIIVELRAGIPTRVIIKS